ncbi:2-oxoglutarate dehydrogenase subunit E1 [Phenylobacterium sp. Root77]|uniref:2-oxoglutarate dehydrogenase E1 component n=1 Tax=unclassified Phenylobacterium TaxID=2640670 RepID=UPI0006F1C4BA|nr:MULTISPECIES: 2-oxoglutarate dehydrogenase E1 component [unclassified Phenylobacterium]KQW65972.1 2-oxoglutarate dehydrogenase subunit E1 [Phenylobacterium sp. Root1277]KQW95681.1 2-oxoglutarate dehydrogenase subunit E1 [Phenylobacterium sp. Root1290]KRC41470.1 2-oxoglutarate dehydrogenase subunit E1 [Phenylobacterium sp. Root77]
MADDGSLINEVLAETSFLYGGNAAFVEDLYARWVANPASVDASWQAFFASLNDRAEEVKAAAGQRSWTKPGAPAARPDWLSAIDGLWPAVEAKVGAKVAERAAPSASPESVRAATLDSLRAIMMIRAYRMRGHLRANLDPLGITVPDGDASELDPATYGFTEADYDRPIFLDYVLGLETGTIREILTILKRTYCGDIGVQYMHISDPAQKAWLQERIEGRDKEIHFTKEGKVAILKKLIEAEGFERFLHKRYPGTKRFGLDGGEAMVPAMEQIIKRGGALGVRDIVLGMPHRGRLNVLAAVMAKPYHVIFHEFQGGSSVPSDIEGSGDVKYHMGASSDRAFDGNNVHLSLTANPSHLEIVNPVVLGKARAKQAFTLREAPESGRGHVLPLLLHGDAAFAGQGVVAECFAISGTKGYRTGGTIHFIVNNQIGFTTAPQYSRSSPYPSDVALMVEAPIFHVNGDDPEAVTYVAKVATEFRQQFGKDVVIDMFCYRRFGHNEGDDPTMTSPLMYAKIKDHPPTRELYARKLVAEGVATEAEVAGWVTEFEDFLDKEFEAGKTYKANKADWLDGKWAGLALPEGDDRRGDTSVPMQKLVDLGQKITAIPERLDVHKTVRRAIENRRAAIEAGEGLDWATGEHLAFASLLDEGFPVRLAGQDSVRGTFVQRHTDLIDQKTEEHYTPLSHLRPGQAHFEVIDSALSEEAVLGFEYGFSLADPKTLTLWEAQFGDFANGAQVVIDQFISSGERKWLRMSGLVMLLPHGYEGQGPEHSSARLERFLQLCAEDNLQVVNCSTPANYFHALRRQQRREFRKPLIVMTPKSLLRHKKATSTMADLAEGSSFHRVLNDDAERGVNTSVKLAPPDKIRRVVLCSGKVYYDLLDAREEKGVDDVYIMRLEQFYPWPVKSLSTELSRFPNAELVWCQEEPKNMGGWTFVDPWLELTLERLKVKAKRARYVGRPASASTAAGLMSRHMRELQNFLADAFA